MKALIITFLMASLVSFNILACGGDKKASKTDDQKTTTSMESDSE